MKRTLLSLALVIMALLLTSCGCKHNETELINTTRATCTEEGYTGDTVCLKCKETIAKGEIVERLPHTEKTMDTAEPSCTEDGYTGDVYCSVCGELLAKGEAIPAKGHTESDLMYVRNATCTEAGYTGDIYCTVCDELLKEGEPIEPLAHVPGEPQGVTEATCTSYGYSGDVYCTVCNGLLELGESIDMLEHTFDEPYNVVEATCLKEGYTGDKKCSICGEVYRGSATSVLTHEYKDNACIHCGWRVSGLYVDGKLELTWQQLKDGGYVELEGQELIRCSEGLVGTLVIDEEITSIRGSSWGSAFEAMTKIEYIWLPKGVTSLTDYTFIDCVSLREVTCYAECVSLDGDYIFGNCHALEHFDICYGVEVIPKGCFYHCSSLEEIEIPETVKVIETKAFLGTALTEITLNPGLLKVDLYAFNETGIKEITLPYTVAEIEGCGYVDGDDWYNHLEKVDASACNVEHIGYGLQLDNFANLKEFDFPKSLKTVNVLSLEGYYPKVLILPDGFTGAADGDGIKMEDAEAVVWPASMTVATWNNTSVHFDTVYYRGSEVLWNLISGVELVSYSNIVFNYEGDGSELME